MSAAGLRVFESGEGRPLDVAGIQKDLAALWKEASSAGKEPAMRASRANLIVLLEGKDPASSGVETLIADIASSYPSRVLLVRTAVPAAAGTLTASVSALCSLGSGARYICCERISIDAARGVEPSIPGTVLSLLLGDLPAVIWVPGELPLAAPWFRALVASSDRLLIDSSFFASPGETLSALTQMVGSLAGVDLADFEWLRLAAWRHAVAAAFDRVEAREAAREGFERVTFFEQTPSTEASAASLLLRAWIASCVRTRSFEWHLPREGGATSPPASDASPGGDPSRGISGILFEGRTSTGPFRCNVPAPCTGRPLRLSDFACLIGGQRDYPLGPAWAPSVRP